MHRLRVRPFFHSSQPDALLVLNLDLVSAQVGDVEHDYSYANGSLISLIPGGVDARTHVCQARPPGSHRPRCRFSIITLTYHYPHLLNG